MAAQFQSSIGELVTFVRKHSPFYSRLYESLAPDTTNLEDLPITNNAEYWKAARSDQDQVLTGPLTDALVRRSGGSSGEPKTIFLSRHEFHLASQINGSLFAQYTGVVPGDIIANLSSQGGLYSGFMTYGYCVMNNPLPCVNLAISGKEPLDFMAQEINRFKATVIISNVFIATKLANYLRDRSISCPSVRLILYTGEAFYKDLKPLYSQTYPSARVSPLSYACAECTIMAWPSVSPLSPLFAADDEIHPVYRVNTAAIILEIIDSHGRPIKENGRRGTVVVTHLLKRLQPTIRYEVGDVAEWVDFAAATFRLGGRDAVGLKIGTAMLDQPTMWRVVARVLGDGVDAFQAVVRRSDGRNEVTFRVAAPHPADPGAVRRDLEEEIVRANPAWGRNRDAGLIAPVQVQWVKFDELAINEKSGKFKEIVEERY